MSKTLTVAVSDWTKQLNRGLYSLLGSRVGCNVAIYGSDQQVLNAHACVLMAVSARLRDQLTDDVIQGCHSLEINTITSATWRHLLDFMYTGAMSRDVTDCDSLAEAAQELKLESLTDLIRRHKLREQVRRSSPDYLEPIKFLTPPSSASSLTSQPVFPALSPTKYAISNLSPRDGPRGLHTPDINAHLSGTFFTDRYVN